MNITEKEFEALGTRLVIWQVLYTKTIDGYKLFLPKFDIRINWIKSFLMKRGTKNDKKSGRKNINAA